MDLTRDIRVRMERAHVHAWPALRSAVVEGWLWRGSGGGSQRANSVSTIDFTGNDLDAAIAAVEARYQASGAVSRYQTFDETSPAELVPALLLRGYRQANPTTTMFKRCEVSGTKPGSTADIETTSRASPEWYSVYLGEITENRRLINSQIIEHVPPPCRFFACRRDGRIIATALCVVSFGCAVIECVTTRTDARRQGAAREVLGALEAWATEQAVDWIGLQVAADNTPAIRLYEQLGYRPGAINQFWVRPTEQG